MLGFCDFKLNEKEYPEGFAFDAEDTNFPLEGLRYLTLILFSVINFII